MSVLSNIFEADAKALPNTTFFKPGGAPISTYVPGSRNPRDDKKLLSQREAARHLQSYGGDQAIDWVYNATNLYSDTAASAPWHIISKDGDILYDENDPYKPEKAKTAPFDLIRLLAHPNPFMDYEELMELLVIDLLLVGNAYWLKYRTNKEGKPLALYRMSPLHVKVKPDTQGIIGYEYQPPGVSEPTRFKVTDVIHFKRPNPHSPYYGLGVVQGGGRPFDLELALTDATASYFENKADPSLIVESERRVSKDVFSKLRAQLRARLQGPRRAGELLVLESGLKAKTLTPSARDAMYSELADKSRDRILAIFRVHPKLLGITAHSGESGGDKVQDIRREFDNKTMRPFLDRLQRRVSDEIAQAWDLNFQIEYRYTMPQEEAVKLSGDFGSIPGVKVKEVRRFLVEAGLLREESTGDNEIDDTVLNMPGEELDENGQGGFADRPLPREPGRPPLGKNTRSFGSTVKVRKPQGKAFTGWNDLEERLQAVVDEGKALTDDNVRVTVGNKLPDERRPTDTFAGQRQRDVDVIAAALTADLANVAKELETGLLEEGKALRKIASNPAWKRFQAQVGELLEKYTIRGLSIAAVQHGNTTGIDYETVAKGIVYRPEGALGIVQTFKAQINAAVEAATDGTEAADIIKEQIALFQSGHSKTIGLTEAVHAYNEGTLLSLEAAGHSEVYVEDGDDFDEPCQTANGSVWTIEEARANRLEHPNCRRAFLALPQVA